MNLEKLNTIAKGEACIPITDLVQDQLYVIQNIRKVKTTNWGEKIVVDLEGDKYSYLPVRISKDLLANNEEGLKEFQDQLEVSTVSIRR